MKKGQIFVLLVLFIIMTVIVWFGACNSTNKKPTTEPTATPTGTNVELVTPTFPPENTEEPSGTPTPTPTPENVVFPEINENDFSGLSTTSVTWEAGFNKNEDGTTNAYYNTSLDKYIKGFDYIFTKNDSSSKKEIYLTFNISWDQDSLTRILDIIKAHNDSSEDKVYVTFFVQSDCLEWDVLMKRIYNEGHQLAIRAFPDSMSESSPKELQSKLLAVEAKYRSIFGNSERMYYYRPGDEFSTREIAVANAMGYKVVFYSFHYRDWDTEMYNADGTNGKINAMKAVLDNFHDGSVIQLLVSELNADILNKLIEEGLSQGFSFERLDQ